MAQAYFRVELTVRPKAGGGAEIVAPAILNAGRDSGRDSASAGPSKDLTWHFVVVKDGAEEGIVTVEGTNAMLAQVAKDPACTKLTKDQLDAALKAYPAPRLKKKLQPPAVQAETPGGGRAVVEAPGNRPAETVQSVRAGFYIIDVPIVSAS